MNYRPFASTGVKVSPLCLGAMMFGAWGNPDHDEGIAIIHRALEVGINFIDTADVYSRGESEEIVGKALAGGRRDNVFLATKVHGPMGDDPNEFGNSRRWIAREVDNSLRRLKTDWIDLYQIHRPEADTDIDETLGVLSDLVRAGKVRYIGSSTFPASRIVEAQWTAHRRGRASGSASAEQPPYSMLAVRGRERRASDLSAPRDGRDPLEPACRRMADRALPRRPGPSRVAPCAADPGALRHVDPRQPAKARGGRRARQGRRRGRDQPDRDGACKPASATLPRPRRSPGHGRWCSAEATNSVRPTRSCPTRCSTGSTRSSRPERT